MAPVQPRVAEVLVREPWRLAFPLGAVAALVAAPLAHRRGRDRLAFASWSGFLALLVASAAFGLYPWLLPSSIDPRYALSIAEASAAEPSLRIGAVWWPIGIGLALAYTGYVHWRFWGRAGARRSSASPPR